MPRMTLKWYLDWAFLLAAFALLVLIAIVAPGSAKASELFPGVNATGEFVAGNARYIDGLDVTGENPGVTVTGQLGFGWLYTRASIGNLDRHLMITGGAQSDGVFGAGVAHTFDLGFGAIDFDVGGQYYEFFGSKCDVDFYQFYGRAGGTVHGFKLTGGVVYSPDLLNGLGRQWRFEGGAAVPLVFLTNDVALLSAFGNAAYNTIEDHSVTYTDWQAGIEADRGPWFGRVYYAANDLPDGKLGDEFTKDRVVVELGAKLN